MRKHIKKILQESEMTEMGMKIEKLKGFQPQNYLVKSLKDKEKGNKVKEKDWVLQLNDLYKDIVQSLTNLQWHELKLTLIDGHFYLILPSYIKTKIKKLSYLYDKVGYGPYRHLVQPLDKIDKMRSDYVKFIENDEINTYIEDYKNRTHFPSGLPNSLLGFNLGYKLYRKLLDKLRFIQSSTTASDSVQNVYRQLIEQSDLNCVITKTSVLILRRDLPKEEKIKIVSEFIYGVYHDGSYPRPFVVNRDLVLDGPLLRELNENKIERLSKELFNFSKNATREPFKEFPYEFQTHDEGSE